MSDPSKKVPKLLWFHSVCRIAATPLLRPGDAFQFKAIGAEEQQGGQVP